MDAPWDIVCFGSVDWDAHRQRPQAVMTVLAERGARVVYIDNLGLRVPRLADASRVRRRLDRWLHRRSHGPASSLLLARESPVVLPQQNIGLVRALALRSVLRGLGRHELGRSRPLVVWTYLPVPVAADVARELNADALVYDWCDDACERLLTNSERVRRRVRRWEDAMVARADVVFVASKELLRRRGSPNANIVVVPHGISPVHIEPGPDLPELAGTARPRVVFVGSISEWVDLDLIEGVAAARPEWTVIMAGPARVRLDSVTRHRNVRHVGVRAPDEIAGLLAACDAALVPYQLSAGMTAASPMKLREYLAHGLPVVSVDIPEVHEFIPEVEIASGVIAFIAALERALKRGRHDGADHAHLWADRVHEMIQHVDKALPPRTIGAA